MHPFLHGKDSTPRGSGTTSRGLPRTTSSSFTRSRAGFVGESTPTRVPRESPTDVTVTAPRAPQNAGVAGGPSSDARRPHEGIRFREKLSVPRSNIILRPIDQSHLSRGENAGLQLLLFELQRTAKHPSVRGGSLGQGNGTALPEPHKSGSSPASGVVDVSYTGLTVRLQFPNLTVGLGASNSDTAIHLAILVLDRDYTP